MSESEESSTGLDLLLELRESDPAQAQQGGPAGSVRTVDMEIDVLRPGRYQPRQTASEQSLAELADSIREQGVLQPIVARRVRAGAEQGFEIVAGERRWRAAKLAGLARVPVILRELDDQSALAVALIENLQREDLNPIDQARSLSQLADEFQLTHDQVGKAVGRSRASVSNLMRLLDLNEEVKNMLATGRIDMGHARALLPLDAKKQVSLARRVQKRGLSVRQVEKTVRELLTPSEPAPAQRPIDLQTQWLQQQLARELQQRVTIAPGRGGEYHLHLSFADLAQLQETLARLLELVDQLREAAGPRARDASK